MFYAEKKSNSIISYFNIPWTAFNKGGPRGCMEIIDCQKFDDFKMVLDLLEYKAKQNGR